MKIAIILFPGINRERELFFAIEKAISQPPRLIWHKEQEIGDVDCVVLPGGFSYGDYLRSGAIAAQSPIMRAVHKAAKDGRYVLGICNGFQVLTETGLLPGALLRNQKMKFTCKTQWVRVEPSPAQNLFLQHYQPKEVLRFPIANNDGNYQIDKQGLQALQAEERIALRYCDEAGNIDANSNPNGSIDNIAGVFSANRRVLGMMPHPENAALDWLDNQDGARLFQAFG